MCNTINSPLESTRRYNLPLSSLGTTTMICSSALGGEENIMNDESPHKCHSIKTYHIPTFFNKDISVKQLLQLYSNPKINFDLPISKNNNFNISLYDTPMSLDISVLTNSLLNLSGNPED